MMPVDDYILEELADAGAGTPQSLALDLDYNNDYLGTRCRKLVAYGLLERPTKGLYRITEEGREYLSGALDASELEEG